jgi:glycosyltransferase involved in cell wall biosynthesis
VEKSINLVKGSKGKNQIIMKNFALVSIALPPSHSGQSMVIYNLLKNTNSDRYFLISQKNFYQYKNLGNCSNWLNGKHYFLHPDYQIVRLLTKCASILKISGILEFILKIKVNQIENILKNHQCDVVIGCTGDLFDPPAVFIACKNLGIPFIFYTMDYYSRQWTDSFFQIFADKYEPEIVHNATKIIVLNEFMKEVFFQRYNVNSTVIHYPFEIEEYENNAKNNAIDYREKLPSSPRIVYTGAIYEAHYSAFRNLISAIEKSKNLNIKLHLYTPQSETRLRMNLIVGPVELHKPIPNCEIPNAQRNADILFLPLAFNSAYPDVIKTSAPGKIAEYLASKTPILVHAPKDSFIAWYFKKYNCGLVIDEENTELLSQAIERLINDKKFCQEITQNAYDRAKIDFDANVSREKIFKIIEESPNRT